MDIDHLKSVWETETPQNIPKISLEKQSEIHLPLEKIRKNMRMEFYITVVGFLFIILFMAFADFHIFKFKFYVIALVGSMMLITAFYFLKFFSLYKNLSSIDLNLLENLKDLRFQFKLNEQYYLAFYISFVPFVVGESFLLFEFLPNLKSLDGIAFIGYFLLFCLFLLGSLYVVGKWWFSKYYGKYFAKINILIGDLK